MTKKLFSILGIAAAVVACSAPAFAGSTSSTMTVSGTVVASCTVNAPPSLPAMTIDGINNTGQTASANLNITCTNQAPVTIGIDFGAHPNGTSNRTMLDASGNSVPYNVYQDAADSILWGNTAGTNTESITGTGAGQGLTLYIKSTADATVPPGSYSDTLNITLSY